MQFEYQGVDKEGKKVSGTMDAPGEGELRMSLRSIGVRPTKISKGGGTRKDVSGGAKGGGKKVKIELLVAFTRQLQVLISSGVPIVQALDVLAEQATDEYLKSVITTIKDKVSSGSYLWEAMSTYPRVFPRLYLALIRAGESSGSIDQMLKRLSRYLEDANRLQKMLKSAMIYPIGVVCVAVGVIGGLLYFVIPKFKEFLESSGQQLPWPTQMVISASEFVVQNIVVILIVISSMVYLINRFINSPEGKIVVDRIMFRAPLFGNLVQKSAVARFSRTMQTLLASGVNLIDAIDICKATIDNTVLEEAVSKIRGEVEAGKTLGMVVTRLSVFPKMAVQMISVGESTGNLDKMLEKVADFYEEEVEVLIQGLTKLIEPVLLVVLGGIVGALMIAMYLPIFQQAGGVQ